MRDTGNSRTPRRSDRALLLVVPLLICLSVAGVGFCWSRGYTLYYGDAESRLNHARRILDSRTPGPEQIGSPWLPLPHLLMLPFASNDPLWHNGLAGAIPSAGAYVLAGAFLFAAARRLFGTAAAAGAAAVFALNPNLLYLQATPMTEALFLASLTAVLYFIVRYRERQSLWTAALAGAATCAGTLTRYEAWFLLPFAAAYFAFGGRRPRLLAGAVFGLVAMLGPLAWLAHNAFYFSDPLYFYRGPYSHRAIQGDAPYPGKNDWLQAWHYFGAAGRLCIGLPLFLLGFAGAVAAMIRRVYWPVSFLALPLMFYVWSMHSSRAPIFVPELWPHSYYNTRYGMAWLPFAALCAAALVAFVPARFRGAAAMLLPIAALAPWARLDGASVVTWKESEVNSAARRAWTGEAARILAAGYRPGAGIFTTFSDITGVYRTARIPLRETLTDGNGPYYLGPSRRPDLFLREEWAVVFGGDPVQTAINRSNRAGPYYMLTARIAVDSAPVVEIWRRSLPAKFYANPVHQSPRGEERFSVDVGRRNAQRGTGRDRAGDL
jgi:hypothetical protein